MCCLVLELITFILGCLVIMHELTFRMESLNRGQGSVYFLDTFGGYKLWCNEEKSPGFIISRNVMFNESASLTDRQKEDAIAESDRRTNEQVKIEVNKAIQSQIVVPRHYI